MLNCLQGIAVMAHTPSVGEEAESGVVDLSDPANILMRGIYHSTSLIPLYVQSKVLIRIYVYR